MTDVRAAKLACNLLDYSTEIKKGEVVYIEWKGQAAISLVKELIKGTIERGATPLWIYHDDSLLRDVVMKGTKEQISAYADIHTDLLKKSDAYILINGSDNPFEMSDVPIAQQNLFRKYFVGPVHSEQRVKHTKWCVLRYPNNAMAQLAETSRESFENFFYAVCNLDYSKLSLAMDSLVTLMNKTDRVNITGEDTKLTFSIKNIPAVKCDGKLNIPDGEVFTAPVKESINGTIKFNSPALSGGAIYDNIRLTFKDGKITHAACDGESEKLNKILDTDNGARYCGEFAIGVNPYILKPMKDGLFDEKIYGSIHLTPGKCYDEASNGNTSSIHWDLVHIQTPEYGGGEIYFDEVLIRKDGEFVHPDLKTLNAKALR